MGGTVRGRDFRSRVGRFVYRSCRGGLLLCESDPIASFEWLLRRVHPENFNPNDPIPFSEASYQASSSDVDGISFFREFFLSPVVLHEFGRQPPYVVARVRARQLIALGLTIDVTPDKSMPPGHVSIPELKKSKSKVKRRDARTFRIKLAQISDCAFVPTGFRY